MSQKIYFGYGVYKELSRILKKHTPHSIFLVTGKKSFTLSGAEKLLEGIVNKYNHIRFYNFENNPKLEDIKKAYAQEVGTAEIGLYSEKVSSTQILR